MRLIYLPLFLPVLLLSGCGERPPGDDDIKQAMQGMWDRALTRMESEAHIKPAEDPMRKNALTIDIKKQTCTKVSDGEYRCVVDFNTSMGGKAGHPVHQTFLIKHKGDVWVMGDPTGQGNETTAP